MYLSIYITSSLLIYIAYLWLAILDKDPEFESGVSDLLAAALISFIPIISWIGFWFTLIAIYRYFTYVDDTEDIEEPKTEEFPHTELDY